MTKAPPTDPPKVLARVKASPVDKNVTGTNTLVPCTPIPKSTWGTGWGGPSTITLPGTPDPNTSAADLAAAKAAAARKAQQEAAAKRANKSGKKTTTTSDKSSSTSTGAGTDDGTLANRGIDEGGGTFSNPERTSGGGTFEMNDTPILDISNYVAKAKYTFNPPPLRTPGYPTSVSPPDLSLPMKGFIIQDPIAIQRDTVEFNASEDGNTHEPITFTKSKGKYGFRFQYNPEMIAMSAGFAAGLDLNTIANHSDAMFNPILPQSGATIQINLLINRIEDLAYHTLTAGMYAGPITAQQIKDIQAKGTMVDIEALLMALNHGMLLPTKYRGETIDYGWLQGGQTVLKLNNSKMVYQGFIDSLSWNHTRFNSKMIPTLTSLQINFLRYADILNDPSTLGPGSAPEGSGVTAGTGTFTGPGSYNSDAEQGYTGGYQPDDSGVAQYSDGSSPSGYPAANQ